MTNCYSKSNFKNLFELYEADGTHHIFIRPEKRWYDVAECEVLAKDRCIPKGYAGIIPDARPVTDEEVAELVAKEEERKERLKSAEAELRKWVWFSEEWKKIPKRKRQLQKKEVSK